jgi:Abnormal spindle-like microcephaly-assoc'd, ASPM-SPD-2-Hydin
MPLPRAMRRSLLCLAVISVLLLLGPPARAADEIANKTSAQTRAERLILTPSNLRFGNVAFGRRKVQTVTITNAGDSDITLLQVTKQGKGFTLSGLDLPLTLTSGGSFTFSVRFAPRSLGDSSGSISFLSDVSIPILRTEMTGTGVDADRLTIDPATMKFGAVQVGSIASQGGTLIAAHNPVAIFSAVSSSPDFILSGLSFPLTIGPRGKARFMVTFAPLTPGEASATLSFRDSSGNTVLAIESLKGVATVSQAHTVDLSWKASTSRHVIGYNIYRGNTSGGPYRKINPVLNASTLYTDTSVTKGYTYYYVATAVNSKDKESRYSKQVRATIP